MQDSTAAAEPPRSFPRLKVLYLLAVSVAVFVIPVWTTTQPYRWYVVPGLVFVQAAILLTRVSPLDVLRSAARLKWLFAFLVLCYAVLPGGADDSIAYWQPMAALQPIAINLTGLEAASLMCLQILAVIWVSSVVRLLGPATDVVTGLRGFGVPRLFALSIDTTLALIGGVRPRRMGGGGGGGGRGRGGGGGGGGGRGAGGGRGTARADERTGDKDPNDSRRDAGVEAVTTRTDETPRDESRNERTSPFETLRRILRGDLGFFVESIERSLIRARDHVEATGGVGTDERLAHDVSVISGVALAMMSFKLLKVLPSVPFMPGWKTLFFYPLYILAAHLTYTRWGGTTAGAIIGVLGYMQGDGQYGVFEILKHLVPGLVIDLVWPALRRVPRSAIVFCLLGFVVSIARTTTEFVIMLFLLVRWEAFLFVVLKLVSNLVAGTLSGLVTYFVLPAFRGVEPRRGVTLASVPVTESAVDAGTVPRASGQFATAVGTCAGAPGESQPTIDSAAVATPAGEREVAVNDPTEVQS